MAIFTTSLHKHSGCFWSLISKKKNDFRNIRTLPLSDWCNPIAGISDPHKSPQSVIILKKKTAEIIDCYSLRLSQLIKR